MASLSTDVLRAEMSPTNNVWMSKFVARDTVGLGGLYTADAQLLPSNVPPQVGREAIGKFIGMLKDMGVAKAELHVGEVGWIDSDRAWERSKFVFKTAEGKVADVGKYIVEWKRVGGSWYYHRVLFNSDGKVQSDIATDIKAANEVWMTAFKSKDVTALGNCYTENARLMPPGHETVIGRASIGAFFGGAMKAGVAAVELKIDEVSRGTLDDATAIERSSYIFRSAAGDAVDDGKYIVIWKRVNGKWLLDNDIFCSNRAAA